MNKVYIREAAEADLPLIQSLYDHAGINDGESFSSDETLVQFRRLRCHPYFHIFVASVGNDVLGTYNLFILDTLAKRGRRSGLVEAVAVDPNYQGQGIGRAMMLHAMDQCRRAGCYKLALSSNLNREAAHSFYEALGFEKHGYSFQVTLLEQEPRCS